MEATNTLLDRMWYVSCEWKNVCCTHAPLFKSIAKTNGRENKTVVSCNSVVDSMCCSWSQPQPHREHINSIWNTTNAKQWTACLTSVLHCVQFVTNAIHNRLNESEKAKKRDRALVFLVFNRVSGVISFFVLFHYAFCLSIDVKIVFLYFEHR